MQAVETPITTKGAAVLALGILSSLSDARFKLRRTVLRDSWLRFPNSRVSVQARFVVRCGQHQEPVTPWHAVARAENTSGDMLCAAAPTSDGRLRGPIIALVWWLRHATVAFPMAAFYGKCDDDVYLHLPSVENMLRGVPLALASQAYVGYVMYAQLELSISSSNPNETRYEFHAFAPTAIFSRLASKPQSRCRESRGPGSRSAHTPTNTHSCFGPLPFQCGPFYAIGRRAVHALLRSRRALDADLRHLRALPPSHPKVLDDAWMGAALWRFVGSRMSIAVLALGGSPLYMDDASRFRGHPSVLIWHNRLKFVHRIQVLHAFHTAQQGSHRCEAQITWESVRTHCCGPLPNLAGQGLSARHTSWPLLRARANASACVRERYRLVDLTRKRRWRGLGLGDLMNLSLTRQA